LPSSETTQGKIREPKGRRSQASELSRHLLHAQEEERKRISRELHDGTGQGLMVLRLYLGMLASESQAPETQAKVQEALRLLDQTVEDLRRIIGRLSPRVLEEMGLAAAVRKAVRDFSHTTGIRADLDLPRELNPLSHTIEVVLYRSLQEALHNIAKHARAKNFVVRMACHDDSISLLVEDDGIGFSGRRSPSSKAFGLLGMEERTAALGGKLKISSKKGSGTAVRVTLPLKEEAEVESRVRQLETLGSSSDALERLAAFAARG
jgi:signal transduction histidine kinase